MQYTLVADGSSDKILMAPIEWLLRDVFPTESINGAFYARVRQGEGLAANLRLALLAYPCEVLFIHRDAENQSQDLRRQEIVEAMAEIPDPRPRHICVIPVRMSEAWFLFNEAAIRRAADKPNGQAYLDLPSLSRVESLPDPKATLYDLLLTASEASGRRRKDFRPEQRVHRLAELIDSYAPLRTLSAFQAFEEDIQQLPRP
jgi:hypothetical protein